MGPQLDAGAQDRSRDRAEPGQHGVELRRLADVWYRRRALILTLVVLTLLGTEFGNWIVYPTYAARARLLIEAPVGLDVPFSRDALVFKKSEITQTQSELLLSQPNLEAVIRRLRLDEQPIYTDNLRGAVRRRLAAVGERIQEAWKGAKRYVLVELLGGQDPPPDPEPTRFDEVLSAMKRPSYVDVEPIMNTDVIEIIVRDRDPDTAAAIANGLADVFLERETEARKVRARATHDAIEQRLTLLRPELEAAREALARFKVENQLADLDRQIESTLQMISLLELTYWDVSQKEAVRTLSQWEAVRQHQTAERDVDVRAKTALVERMSELARLETLYQPDHAKVVAARAAVEELQRQIGVGLAEVGSTPETATGPDTESLKRSLLEKLGDEREELARLTRLNTGFRALTWNEEQSAEVLKFLFRKREDALTAEWTTQPQARVIAPAEAEFETESPAKWRNRILALITALAVAITGCALLEYLDSTLRRPADVARRLGLRTLGSLPYVTR